MKEKTNTILKKLCVYILVISMMFSSLVGSWDVMAAGIEAPTVTKAFIGTNTISGGNLHRGKINGKNARGTVHVTLKDSSGNEKATVSVTPKSGKTWTVKLPDGVTIAEGDVVTAYQEFDGQKSLATTANAMDSLAKQNKDKLKMPQGEIWIEQYVANIVNDDEKAEAIDLLKKANPTIAKDIKSVEFKITGVDSKTASYTVTYTDDSKTEEIQAPGLTIKPVTETSRSPEIDSITIVDNVVKGKLAGEGPFDGIKVQLVLRVNKDKAGQYCNENKCTVDKDSSKPVDVTLQDDGTFSYTLQTWESLELDQIVGVSVKEPHKFVSCSTTTVKPVTPEKTEVKDPRKLTSEDKKAIDAAIRKAFTVNGVSKLPNGTGDWEGVPAVIQFDDSGNVKIFSGNDVKGDWDAEGNFVPEKNEDGSYKVNDGVEPKITIPAKDIVKNIKPDAPTVALSEDKKIITITPNEKDTDAHIITVSYKYKDGKDQTTTATKSDNGWTIEGEGSVDSNGVITLPKDKVKGGTDVTATVTDKGGIADDDKTPLTSEQGTLTVEETKADKVKALGGLDPVVMKKWVGDKLNWKEGVKAKDDAKKDKIEELLKGAKFEEATEEKRTTTKEGDFKGKIKITFNDDSFIEVENQMLYVSNHVTSMERKDKVPTDALEVEFKLGEGTKVDNVGGSGAVEGNKDNPTSYSKYKVKPNTNLKEYKLPTLNTAVVDSIKLKAQEGFENPVWNDQNGKVTNNFIVSESNKEFTATATKNYKVTVVPNGGTGTEIEVTKKKDETYTLPAANTFTPPNENQEFSGWQIGDDTKNLKKAGDEIKITGDTTVKAIWKAIEYKVSFTTEAGASGSMDEKTVKKGDAYELPTPTFTPNKDKEFAGWKVGDSTELKKVGDKIDISGNVTLTATWKDKAVKVKVTYDANGGGGTMDGKTVDKGSDYTVLPNAFTAPEDTQEFDTWEVNGERVAPGAEIKVDKDTVIKAVWKDKDTTTPGGGQPGTEEPGKPQPDPSQPGDGNEPNPNPNPGENPGDNPGTNPGDQPGKPGENDPNQPGKPGTDPSKPWEKPSPDSHAYNPWWPIWFGSSDVKPAEPKVEYERGLHRKYLYGYKDNTVRPEGLITRAEAAALIARLAELDMSNNMKPNFKDTPSAWYNTAINAVLEKNLMFADKDGDFRPNEPITRGEFARAMFFIDKKNNAVAPFADVKGHVYEEAINQAYGNDRIKGYPDGTFKPDATITRAEAATILNHYADRNVNFPGIVEVHKDVIKFKDLDQSHWAYYEIMEAANTHEYQREKGTIPETWEEIIEKYN